MSQIGVMNVHFAEGEQSARFMRDELKVATGSTDFLPLAEEKLAKDSECAPALWIISAHGGAGATTLGHVIAPAADAGQQWPVKEENPFVLIACRSTASGLDAAHSAVLQHCTGSVAPCELLGVVVTADAPGKMPKSLAQRVEVLEDLSKVWLLPYVDEFRRTLVKDLAVWGPKNASEEKDVSRRTFRRRKSDSAVPQVPHPVKTFAGEAFQAAFQAHTARNR